MPPLSVIDRQRLCSSALERRRFFASLCSCPRFPLAFSSTDSLCKPEGPKLHNGCHGVIQSASVREWPAEAIQRGSRQQQGEQERRGERMHTRALPPAVGKPWSGRGSGLQGPRTPAVSSARRDEIGLITLQPNNSRRILQAIGTENTPCLASAKTAAAPRGHWPEVPLLLGDAALGQGCPLCDILRPMHNCCPAWHQAAGRRSTGSASQPPQKPPPKPNMPPSMPAAYFMGLTCDGCVGGGRHKGLLTAPRLHSFAILSTPSLHSAMPSPGRSLHAPLLKCSCRVYAPRRAHIGVRCRGECGEVRRHVAAVEADERALRGVWRGQAKP